MTEWYKSWFSSPDYLKVYGHRDDSDASKLISLLKNSIEFSGSWKILDAPCGNGRHSLKLAREGFIVFGFDLSLMFLKLASERKTKENLDPEFINADLRYIPFKGPFDLILNLFTSFGYFNTDAENMIFPRNAFRLLKKGGYFVLDYFNDQYVINNLVPESERRFNGKKIIERREIKDNRVEKKIKIHDNSNSVSYSESVRLYSYSEIRKNFGDIGFKEVNKFGSYSGDDYSPDRSERLIILYKR